MNVLNITDGGYMTVNLLNLADGFSVDDWRQKIAQYKGGGTWSQSALTDESQLIAKAFDNIIEEIPMPGIVGAEADIAAVALAAVLVLLEKAANYWTDDWRDEPVWLESQSDCETNKQYAIVYTGGFPDLGDPYSHAYLENAVLTDLVLRVVRGHWSSNPPKVGTALPISAVETFDGRDLGNVDTSEAREVTTAAEVYTVNKRVEANITHAYHVDDEVVDVWSGNLMDLAAGAYPYDLFPAAVAAGDFLVIGIECAGPPYYPFSNLIFDIGTANANIQTIWEYWDGAAPWGALSPFDNTDTVPATALDAFTATGVNGVWWDQPSDWAHGNLNTIFGAPAPNVDGYWVRCRVTGLTGGATVPTQQNRDIYSCIWPYIEVQYDDIEGHIDAILKLLIETRSDSDDGGSNDNISSRIIGGLRSITERGDEFTAFINLGNAQNPAGVSTAVTGSTTLQSGTEYPAYYYARYAPALDEAMTAQLDTYINHVTVGAGEFYGTYRVFLRCEQVGGVAGDIGVQLNYHTFFNIQSEVKYTTVVGENMLIDFGELTIPHMAPMELLDVTWIGISCSNSNAPTADLYMYELVLMPIDEFAFDVIVDSATGSVQSASSLGKRINIDSIIDPKRLMRTVLEDTSNSQLVTQWQTIAGDRLKFHPYKTQRYWFVHTTDQSGYFTSPFWIGSRSQMQATQRYLGRRGAG